MEDLKVGLYIFGGVLVYGTLWRILSFHAMASPNTALQHLGKAMSVQY